MPTDEETDEEEVVPLAKAELSVPSFEDDEHDSTEDGFGKGVESLGCHARCTTGAHRQKE